MMDLSLEAHEVQHQRLGEDRRTPQQVRRNEASLKANQVAVDDLRRGIRLLLAARWTRALVLAVVVARTGGARQSVRRQQAESLVAWGRQLQLQSELDEAQVLHRPHHAAARNVRHRLRVPRLQLGAALPRSGQDAEPLGVGGERLRQQRLGAQVADRHDDPPDGVFVLQAGVVAEEEAEVGRRVVQREGALGLGQGALAPHRGVRLRDGGPGLVSVQREQEVGSRCRELPAQHCDGDGAKGCHVAGRPRCQLPPFAQPAEQVEAAQMVVLVLPR
mmetsp:Transcript_115562/g.323105  ORF Transcript_115562/g.323105 Transcript_115562/m.323105 type:complete len:275 (+) Transcript_115562:619-1443(+)